MFLRQLAHAIFTDVALPLQEPLIHTVSARQHLKVDDFSLLKFSFCQFEAILILVFRILPVSGHSVNLYMSKETVHSLLEFNCLSSVS